MARGPTRRGRFRCSKCDRVFSRSEHRARHELSHSSERPYQCNRCASSFFRRDLLVRHLRTVHRIQVSAYAPLPPPFDNEEEAQPKVKSASTSPSAGSVSPSYSVLHDDPPHASNVQVPPSGYRISDALAYAAATVAQHPLGAAGTPSAFHPTVLRTGISRPLHTTPTLLHDEGAAASHNDFMHLSGKAYENLHAPFQQPHSAVPNMTGAPFVSSVVAPTSFPSANHIIEESTAQRMRGPMEDTDAQSRHLLNPQRRCVPQIDSTSGLREIYGYLSRPPDHMTDHNDSAKILPFLAPTHTQLNLYLSMFFNFVYPMYPLIHLPTYVPEHGEPALLLAICAVGAQIGFETVHSELLGHSAHQLILNWMTLGSEARAASSLQRQLSWIIAVLLIVHLESTHSDLFDGENPLLTLCGFLTQLSEELSSQYPLPYHWTTQKEWIVHEQLVRTYWLVKITTTNLTSVMGLLPQKLFSSVETVPVPCHDDLWEENFLTPDSWEKRLEPPLLWRDVVNLIFESKVENIPELASHLSYFHLCIASSYIFSGFLDTIDPGKGPLESQSIWLSTYIQRWNLFADENNTGPALSSNGTIASSALLQLVAVVAPLINRSEAIDPLDVPMLSIQYAISSHPMILMGRLMLSNLKTRAVINMSGLDVSLRTQDHIYIGRAVVDLLEGVKMSPIFDELLNSVIGNLDIVRVPLAIGMPLFQSFINTPALTMFVMSLCMGMVPSLITLLAWLFKYESILAENQSSSYPSWERHFNIYQYLETFCANAGWHRSSTSMAATLIRFFTFATRTIDAWAIPRLMAITLEAVASQLGIK